MKIVEVNKNDNRYIEQIIKLEEENFGKNGGVDIWLLKPLIKFGKVLVLLGSDGGVEGVAEFIRSFDGEEIYLYGICIKKTSHGKGCGKVFMEKILEYMKEKEMKKISLTVSLENYRGIGLYEKLGFERVEVSKDEYGKGVDRLIMEIKL